MPEDVWYVMCSYVTRHGAGSLPGECEAGILGSILPDKTNVPNLWQGKLRYAKHESVRALASRIRTDLEESFQSDPFPKVNLAVTHLNETRGLIRFQDEDLTAAKLEIHPDFAGTARVQSIPA